MITHIRTVGFKGFNIDEDVPQKVIYTGKNKSGKTARAMAIALTIHGYIPFSTAGKLPGDILASFGDESIVTAITIGGKEFARKISRNGKGKASQSVQIDGRKASKETFAIMLDKAGAPRIANTAEFMKQSDIKRVDTLFELFPNPELASIDTEIEIAKEDVSRLEKKKTGAEAVVVRLTASKQAIEVPAGSIAEIKSEIESIESKISGLENQIKQAEIEEAEEKAKAKAKIEAEKEAKAKIKKAKEEGRLEGERLERERIEKEADQKKIDEPEGVSREEALKMIKGMTPNEGHDQSTPENDNLGVFDSFPYSMGNDPPKTEEDWNLLNLAPTSLNQANHEAHVFIDGSNPEVEDRFGNSIKPGSEEVDSGEHRFGPADTAIIKGEPLIDDEDLDINTCCGPDLDRFAKKIGASKRAPGEVDLLFRNRINLEIASPDYIPPLLAIRNHFINEPHSSIQKIIDTLIGAGCGTCAALIVAKQELKKFKRMS